MARTSYAIYQQSLLGLPGRPIEWIDSYSLSDRPFDQPPPATISDEPDYADFDDRVRDLTPRTVEIPAGSLPFRQPHAHRYTTMMFNISTYARLLMNDFMTAGGKIEVREFEYPHERLKLPERTLINATGYGARALFNDESIIPVRGQTARLIPQPEVTYGISGHNVSMVPRSDGLLIQAFGNSGNFINGDQTPNRAVSEASVLTLADLVARPAVR